MTVATGAPLSEARVAVLMVHGRGASARSILGLADAWSHPDVAYVAPDAAGGTWYPHSFLAPLSRNEPALGAALALIGQVAQTLAESVGFERTILLGFSQGACLSLEYAARNARRYGGVVALSGGLIGSADLPGAEPPHDKLFEYPGRLGETPVFLGCSDRDPHIPLERVRESVDVLRDLGGAVTERIYPGMPHAVNDDELAFVGSLLSSLLAHG